MSQEFVITRSINALGRAISKRVSISTGGGYVVDESIPGPSTNLEIALVIDVSQLKFIAISCSTAISLFFNEASTGTPSKTLVLAANDPFVWDTLSNHANPFGSTDVTKVFVTKAGAGAAALTILVGVDPTV